MKNRKIILAGILAMFFFSGCASLPITEAKKCSERTDDFCVDIYKPVCANDGKTYTNRCSACANLNVDFYWEEACPWDPEKQIGPPKNDQLTEQQKCENQGGFWKAHCGLIGDCCNFKTSDAGKECTDGSECDGTCLAETTESTTGKCGEWKIQFGCYNFFEDEKIMAVCVD